MSNSYIFQLNRSPHPKGAEMGICYEILSAKSDLLTQGCGDGICNEDFESKVGSPYPKGAEIGIWDKSSGAKSDLLTSMMHR